MRQKVLHQMIEQMDSESKKHGSEKPTMNLDEATKILQMHERARQGRLRAKFMWELSMEEERKRKISKGTNLLFSSLISKQFFVGLKVLSESDAATMVQKKWRGYIARQKTKTARSEELTFIGMRPGETKPVETDELKKAKDTEDIRRERLKNHEDDYQR